MHHSFRLPVFSLCIVGTLLAGIGLVNALPSGSSATKKNIASNSVSGKSVTPTRRTAPVIVTPRDTSSLVVTTTADENDGTSDPSQGTGTSLREAINYANTLSSKPIITFNLSGKGTQTIQLGSQLPAVASSMTIQGPGADLLIINGGGQTGGYRILQIKNSSTTPNGGPTVTLSGLTLSNGYASEGGGIDNEYGVLMVQACTISTNVGSFVGGGGIYNYQGTVRVLNSTFSGNSASNNFGSGGGIENNAGTLSVVNSTLANNTSANIGGAISTANSGVATVLNCTLSGNSAPTGASFYIYGGATLNIGNTILKKGAQGNNFYSIGTVNSLGNNLSDDAAGGDNTTAPGGYLNHSGDQRNTDPQLAAAGLADNVGPTQTIALQSTSPAINAGNNSLAVNPGPDGQFGNGDDTPLYTDQRGNNFQRRIGSNVDIGAYEYSNPNFGTSLEVTTTADEDDGTSSSSEGTGTSLREAINYANSLDHSSTITFSLGAGAHTIQLSSQLPAVATNVTIQGPGASLLTLNGSGTQNTAYSLLLIDNGTETTNGGPTVGVSGLTFNNGASEYGTLDNEKGNLTVNNCVFSNNTAGEYGGGIDNSYGTLSAANCTFNSNTGGDGGGITNYTGTLSVTNCTFSGNTANFNGGGVFVFGGSATIANSTFTHNTSVDSNLGATAVASTFWTAPWALPTAPSITTGLLPAAASLPNNATQPARPPYSIAPSTKTRPLRMVAAYG